MLKCSRCKAQLGDLNYKLTGQELTRFGKVVPIVLCLSCFHGHLTELEREIFFKVPENPKN